MKTGHGLYSLHYSLYPAMPSIVTKIILKKESHKVRNINFIPAMTSEKYTRKMLNHMEWNSDRLKLLLAHMDTQPVCTTCEHYTVARRVRLIGRLAHLIHLNFRLT